MNELIDRALTLSRAGGRRILGIAGPPGAGKSTIAAQLVDALGRDTAVLVPMDGFHLSDAVLTALGRRGRKGAPDTFDVAGYVALLDRIRTQRSDAIYAPTFDRRIEEPVAASIAIDSHVPLVVTEGNYLLLADGRWADVRPLLDEAWYVDIDAEERRRRLVVRHSEFGKSMPDAYAWAHGSDERNAALVAPTASLADLVVH